MNTNVLNFLQNPPVKLQLDVTVALQQEASSNANLIVNKSDNIVLSPNLDIEIENKVNKVDNFVKQINKFNANDPADNSQNQMSAILWKLSDIFQKMNKYNPQVYMLFLTNISIRYE